ncbi:hypothetical protein CERZMDRAFT_101527 [Cercospora zeae-maydis SCOH1-5]|uniref:Major facilitator superfamily (MFS) profile domain-containing protein n=1 Tax=Cercospora zeae-maydis SCOH1-5 TaxID=717836 RepID=A0A6A6F5G2_9PEZI|nr:hypothetical protein CERZMDRAFT_101527 [Cercospora zeae-maydis SCOH1-5]
MNLAHGGTVPAAARSISAGTRFIVGRLWLRGSLVLLAPSLSCQFDSPFEFRQHLTLTCLSRHMTDLAIGRGLPLQVPSVCIGRCDHLFKNIRFQSAAWNTGIGACVYYGGAIVFPQVVTILYRGRGQISEYDVGTLAGLINMAFVFAQMCHGFVVYFLGPKWSMIGSAIISAALITACATDLDNKALTLGLLIPGSFAIGIVEAVSITTSTFPLRSQEEIGQGGGLSGSIRNFTSAIAVAVFTATLGNRLAVTIPANVNTVATGLGLPASSLSTLAIAVQGRAPYESVLGIYSGNSSCGSRTISTSFQAGS